MVKYLPSCPWRKVFLRDLYWALFIVFINDLPLNIPNGDIDMYADDSTITTSAKTVNQLNGNLNEVLHKVSNWCNENKMIPNINETKCMLIASWQQRLHLTQNEYLCVLLNGIPLENVTSKSLLGVTTNHNLSWEDHINFTVSKINRIIALLRRIKRYLPLSASILKEISFWKDFFGKWRKFEGKKNWRKFEGNLYILKIMRKKPKSRHILTECRFKFGKTWI